MSNQEQAQVEQENITAEQVSDIVNTAEILESVTEESAEPTEVELLQTKISALETQVKEAKEGQARANAESYNAQRRMEQETEKAKKFALQKFAKELLEVADNFERALASTEQVATDQSVIEGLQLTHKSLMTTLEKHGVTVVNPLGEKFNPDFHEAVGIFPDAEPDHVGVVLQKGYTLNGRSIRPAMVQIGA